MTDLETLSNVVAIGVCTRDIIAAALGSPGADGRVVAENLIEGGGGPASTAAVALARLGIEVRLIARTGDDEEALRIRAALEREGVNVEGVRSVPGARSSSSVILVDLNTGDRAITVFQGTFGPIELNNAELEVCATARWLHVDQSGFAVVPQLRRAGIRTPVSLDAGNPVPGLDLREVTLYAPTEPAILRTFSTADLDSAIDQALSSGPSMVAVTSGSRGSLLAERRGGRIQIVREPAYRQSRIVSTLGAGDVFHGALLAALVRGMSGREALRYANAAAAISCEALDGRSGIQNDAQVRAALGS
jgi:sulfofructose kinase